MINLRDHGIDTDALKKRLYDWMVEKTYIRCQYIHACANRVCQIR